MDNTQERAHWTKLTGTPTIWSNCAFVAVWMSVSSPKLLRWTMGHKNKTVMYWIWLSRTKIVDTSAMGREVQVWLGNTPLPGAASCHSNLHRDHRIRTKAFFTQTTFQTKHCERYVGKSPLRRGRFTGNEVLLSWRANDVCPIWLYRFWIIKCLSRSGASAVQLSCDYRPIHLIWLGVPRDRERSNLYSALQYLPFCSPY